MDSPRFLEYLPTPAPRFLLVLEDLGAYTAVSAMISFVIALVAPLAMRTFYPSIWLGGNLEALSNPTMIGIVAATAAGGLVYTAARAFRTVTFARQLSQAAGCSPRHVPVRRQRNTTFFSADPFFPSRFALWIIIAAAGFASLILTPVAVLYGIETANTQIGVLGASAPIVVLALSILLLIWMSKRLPDLWVDIVDPARISWRHAAQSAQENARPPEDLPAMSRRRGGGGGGD